MNQTEPLAALLDGIRHLPWGLHGSVALLMLVGMALWLFGGRLLKPLTVLTFALFGGCVGYFILPTTDAAAGLSPLHAMALGGILGVVVGLLTYRSAMSASCGIVLAVAAPLAMASIAPPQPGEKSVVPLAETDLYLPGVPRVTSDDLERRIEELRATFDLPAPEEPAAEASAGPRPEHATVARVRAFLAALMAEAKAAWNTLSPRERSVYALASVGGLLVGVIIGLGMPAKAAAAVTALLGAALWLPCFVWLSGAIVAPWNEAVAQATTRQWLVAWVVISGVGAAVQWSRLGDRPSPSQ